MYICEITGTALYEKYCSVYLIHVSSTEFLCTGHSGINT